MLCVAGRAVVRGRSVLETMYGRHRLKVFVADFAQQVQRQRQIDCEDASRARQIAHADRSAVRFDAALGDGKAEAEPGSIGAALLEWPK